jgi:hypothetical protein
MAGWSRVPDPEETRSPSNVGWRLWVSSGAAALLVFLGVIWTLIIIEVAKEWTP